MLWVRGDTFTKAFIHKIDASVEMASRNTSTVESENTSHAESDCSYCQVMYERRSKILATKFS